MIGLSLSELRVRDLAMRMYGRAIRYDADQSIFEALWNNGSGTNAPEQSLMMDCARVALRELGPPAAGRLGASTGLAAIEELRMLRNVYSEFVLSRRQADAILAEVDSRRVWLPTPRSVTIGRAPIVDEDV